MKFFQLLVYFVVMVGVLALAGWVVTVVVQIGFWKGTAAAVIVFMVCAALQQIFKFLEEL